MVRKKIDKQTEYVTTAIGYAVGGQFDKFLTQAQKAGKLRKDIWQEFGSLKAWGKKADWLYKNFQQRNSPEKYQLDFKQWQKTFDRVIDDIHACQESAKEAVVKKIYCNIKDKDLRKKWCNSLNSLEWLQNNVLHRWMRDQYKRGYTKVCNQICIGIGNGAKIVRKSRNVIRVEISGDKVSKTRYEKIHLDFKVGRTTPKGNFQIIYKEDINRWQIHFPRIVRRLSCEGNGTIGVDKGQTEAFFGSDNVVYGKATGIVMRKSVAKRHTRGKGRNKLYQIAFKKNKLHIMKCNLGKKRHALAERKKQANLTRIIRTGVNQIYARYKTVIAEDLSSSFKGKKRGKKASRNLAEWCKGKLQISLEEISYRQKAELKMVNAAYTSQVDHRNGTLLGNRFGDRFLTFTGEVVQSDYNAAQNIKNRATDSEITLYTKYRDVHAILMKRTASFLLEMNLTLQDAVNQGWLDPKHITGQKKSRAKSKSSVA